VVHVFTATGAEAHVVQAGALFVAAALARGRSRQLTRTGRALAERTRDYGRLQGGCTPKAVRPPT